VCRALAIASAEAFGAHTAIGGELNLAGLGLLRWNGEWVGRRRRTKRTLAEIIAEIEAEVPPPPKAATPAEKQRRAELIKRRAERVLRQQQDEEGALLLLLSEL